MLAAGMVLAGCSDDLDENGGGGVIEGATGYVQLALNLPTEGTTTRAANDIFADGLPDEYKVNDGIIAFFSGAKSGTDEDATFIRAYNLGDLSNWNMEGETTDQITSRRVIVQEAPMVSQDNQLYALVILNPKDIVTCNPTTGSLTIGTSNEIQAGGSANLGNIRTFLTNQTVDDYTKDEENASFLMTNAPLANKSVGTDLSVKTLVPVTVYETQAAAEGAENPDEIYVERAVAKVTLSGFGYTNSKYTKTVSNTGENVYNGDVVTLTGWLLNVTNKSTAVVRNVTDYTTWRGADYNYDGSSNRFFGSNAVATNTYRVYWAIDNNYTTSSSDGFTIYTKDNLPEETVWNTNAEQTDKSYPLYCLENTMNASQAALDPESNITHVLLRTTYNFGNSETAEDFFVVTNTPMKKDAFLAYVNEKMEYVDGQKLTTISGDGKIVDTAEEVKTLFALTGGDADTKAEAILKQLGTIKYYKDGSSYYYATRIEHFGDSHGTQDPRDPNVADKSDAKCLGYYGVVRNNWYEIRITSISGPGEPEITPPGDNYGYINAQINILSWAKRTQDVEL